MNETALVCLSGGMDSLAALATADINYKLAVLHFDYGQRTGAKEKQCFHEIADWYKIPTELRFQISTNLFKVIGISCLTDKSIAVPKNDDPHSEDIPVSYVPFRNGNILSAATSIAEAIGATKIFTGFVEEDSSGYPDCREEFVQSFYHAADTGTKPTTHIDIESPVLHMSKGEVVSYASSLNAPLPLTWSCYEKSDIACGLCDSCQLRLLGFTQAGIIDPISYDINIDWNKCIPYDAFK